MVSVTLFFHEPLTTGTFFFRDLYQVFYGKKLLLARLVTQGQMPLWDPMSHGGQPFLATPSNTFFYPTNALFLVFERTTAFNLMIVLQFLLAAIAAYWLARVILLSQWAAFTAGAIFAFGGCSLSTANLPHLILALPWIPVTVGCTHLYLRTLEHRWLTLAAIAAVMPLFGGSVEITMMMFVTIAVWIAFSQYENAGVWRRVRAIIFVGGFAALLSLAQVLPATEVLANSARGSKRIYEVFSEWSLSPRRLPELAIHSFLGHVDRLNESDYWGKALESTGYPLMLSIYFGAVSLLLAITAASNRHQQVHWPRRALLITAVCGLTLSLGSALPFFHALWRWLPFFTIFRYPIKAILISILPIALLAGAAIDDLNAAHLKRMIVAASCFVLAGLAIVASIRFGSASMTHRLASYFGTVPGEPGLGQAQQMSLRLSILHAAVTLTIAGIILAIRMPQPLRAGLLAALIAVDLAVAGSAITVFAPRAFFDEPRLAGLVRQATSDGRFYHAPDPTALSLKAPSDDIMWLGRWKADELSENTAATWGIPVTLDRDYDGLTPTRIVALADVLNAVPWARRIRVLQAAGVSAFMTIDIVHAAGVELVAAIRTAEVHTLYLYRIPSTRMARFVSRTFSFSSSRKNLGAMLGGLPYDSITLERPPAAARDCGTAPVTIPKHSPTELRAIVNAPCRGWVVLAETDYPGWITRVDGRPVTTERADYAFVAVPVAPGPHVIDRRYEPRLPFLGLGASALALSVLMALQFRRSKLAHDAPAELIDAVLTSKSRHSKS